MRVIIRCYCQALWSAKSSLVATHPLFLTRTFFCQHVCQLVFCWLCFAYDGWGAALQPLLITNRIIAEAA